MIKPTNSYLNIMCHFLLLIICFVFFGCSSLKAKEASPEFAKWSAVKTPSMSEPHIYGTYQVGCIAGAKQLPLEGPGYFVVHRLRARYFGHPTMISYLSQLGQQIKQNKYPTMIIGDISFPRGGPFLSGHASHQVGLDVDISLRSVTTLPTPEESESWTSTSYVKDRKILLPNWGKEQVQLTVLSASSPEVNRIFVAPAIKKYFCVNNPNATWLYKLRAWWGHDDHLHVRLNCPDNSPDCKPQAALDPQNNGCGTDLEWWFSAEADAEAKKAEEAGKDPNRPPRPFPDLPGQCEAVRTSQ